MVLAFSGFAFGQQEQQTQAKLTDDQIAKVLVTINEGEIDAAKMAMKKAQAESTKEFAKMMVEEHKNNESEIKNLASKNKISMSNSDLAKTLKEDAKKSNKDLNKTSESDFDKVYIGQQIMMHEKALTTLNDTLIPNAKNPALLDHLKKTQTAVTAHLNHARQMAAGSGAPAGTTTK